MLRRLHIRNYLLIEQLDLELDKGLTIITGETGSGKSILIGALGLVMGGRAEGDLLRTPDLRCIIELELDLKGLGLEEWFTVNELPYERTALLRRQFDPGGRSRAFVNDTPVKLEQLRELGARLVHVHSQHHTLLLNDPRFQLGLVDHVAGHTPDVRSYGEQFDAWRVLLHELTRLREEEARCKAEADFIRFQLDELDQANLLDAHEQPRIEHALDMAEHAEELIAALRQVDEAVSADQGLLAMLSRLRQVLARPARLDARVNALLERLNSVHIELKDIGVEADALAGGVSVDPKEAGRLRERLDLLLRLQQKHRMQDVAALIALREELRGRSGHIDSLGDRIGALEAREQLLRAEMVRSANRLSEARVLAIGPLAGEVERILRDLGMPNAVFRFEHRTGEPAAHGIDTVRALFSANKDRSPAALDKVASGGELARVMLALISLAVGSQGLPTVIFDEIDTGVSGEVADRVGRLLRQMARERQVIAITHLPQIASKGDVHLLVSKDHEARSVHSSIRPLDAEERVQALAQMLSGKRTGKAALENARELLRGR